MLTKIKTGTINGLKVDFIEVEVDISNGLPNINVVGLPDMSIRESKERVRAAIKNIGLEFPMKRITVNLSPADTRKEGSHFDLAIAVGILGASMQVPVEKFQEVLFLGELSLDGRTKKMNGVLPMLLAMVSHNINKVILPKDNLEEAKAVRGIEIVPIENLKELAGYFLGENEIKIQMGMDDYREEEQFFNEDFCDLYGQESLKRGIEIAAAGKHNLLMVGPPGSGKTMAARRIPSILPKMTFEEALEITKIYSIAGFIENNTGLIKRRPFRDPHHTSSVVSITGGGRIPKPGEVSLSHYGVLFLDELPEFNKSVLETLRQPLEDRNIHISRLNGTHIYPADFMLVGAMNPCPCGNYGSLEKHCSCSEYQINRYVKKISGPLLDRIDIITEVQDVSYTDLLKETPGESSRDIRIRVELARCRQLERFKGTGYFFNSQLKGSDIKKYCGLTLGATKLMDMAFKQMNLTARGYTRILKVSRTIADLSGSYNIEENHLAEALQYRNIKGIIP